MTALLPAPGVHRVEPRAILDAAVIGFVSAGWATAVVDLSAALDKSAILATFAHGLGFPKWVGRNWDALDEALRDLSWWPAGECGRLVLVVGLERMTVGTANDREVTLDVLQTATVSWSTTEQPLVVLLTG